MEALEALETFEALDAADSIIPSVLTRCTSLNRTLSYKGDTYTFQKNIEYVDKIDCEECYIILHHLIENGIHNIDLLATNKQIEKSAIDHIVKNNQGCSKLSYNVINELNTFSTFGIELCMLHHKGYMIINSVDIMTVASKTYYKYKVGKSGTFDIGKLIEENVLTFPQ